MKLQNYIRILSKLFFLLFISCKQPTVEPVKPSENKEKETFIRVNKLLLDRDMIRISEYAKRHQLNLEKTESGLHYQVLVKGKGEKISPGYAVSITYKLSLLDGTICYSSDSTGVKHVKVGSGKVENGLDEGLSYLHNGDSAIFILPPHLAYGLLGDNKCIPPRSCIVYHVRVLSLSK